MKRLNDFRSAVAKSPAFHGMTSAAWTNTMLFPALVATLMLADPEGARKFVGAVTDYVVKPVMGSEKNAPYGFLIMNAVVAPPVLYVLESLLSRAPGFKHAIKFMEDNGLRKKHDPENPVRLGVGPLTPAPFVGPFKLWMGLVGVALNTILGIIAVSLKNEGLKEENAREAFFQFLTTAAFGATVIQYIFNQIAFTLIQLAGVVFGKGHSAENDDVVAPTGIVSGGSHDLDAPTATNTTPLGSPHHSGNSQGLMPPAQAPGQGTNAADPLLQPRTAPDTTQGLGQ